MPLIPLRPLAFLMLPALMLAGCDRQSPGPAQPASATAARGDDSEAAGGEEGGLNGRLDIASRGTPLPDLAFADPAGNRLRLADLKGKPVLLNLWATWCGPCVQEMPMLDRLARQLDGKLAVLAVSQDAGDADKVTALFAQRKFARLKPWLDPDMALSSQYNTGVLPTTVLYDAQGKEVWRMIGAHDWTSPRTAAMLDETLGAAR